MNDSARQISLKLPGTLLRRLNEEARARGVKRSHLVTELLESALGGTADGEKPWDRVAELVGRYSLGAPDLGAAHRERLREPIRDRR